MSKVVEECSPTGRRSCFLFICSWFSRVVTSYSVSRLTSHKHCLLSVVSIWLWFGLAIKRTIWSMGVNCFSQFPFLITRLPSDWHGLTMCSRRRKMVQVTRSSSSSREVKKYRNTQSRQPHDKRQTIGKQKHKCPITMVLIIVDQLCRIGAASYYYIIILIFPHNRTLKSTRTRWMCLSHLIVVL